MGIESSKNGIVLVTHGNFGQALIEAGELIVGPQEGVLSLSVDVSLGHRCGGGLIEEQYCRK